MQVQRDNLSETKVKLTVMADQQQLDTTKEYVVTSLGRNVKVQGFRAGKAPSHLIERQIDQSTLQTEFLERVINNLYINAVQEEGLRPTNNPEISITKFVPFTTLEFTAEVEIIGKLKLPDYKKISFPRTSVKVTAKDVDEVLANLRTRAAIKEEVKRVAKDGDEVTIDFAGVDSKTKESINGAEGKDYALILGSKTFIPGFEEQLVGLKAGGEKSFPITFPGDYGVADLQKRKVTFNVTLTKVQKLVEPKLDESFAASIGPFTSLEELKTDIKRQLEVERQQQARSDYNNGLLEHIANLTTVQMPDSLIETEIDRIEEEEKRNLVYRGQTWQEHLDSEGITAEEHRAKNKSGAELRVKAGLILTEVSEREGISVSPEEINVRINLLKGQYSDEAMQVELDKPEGRRDIGSRILSEKTIDVLAEYATAKKKTTGS
jgi:trigger factor